MELEQAAPEGVNEEVVPEAEVSEEAPQWDKEWQPEDEERARFLGWKSPDDWQGELPSGYMEDPRQFVERAESILPFRKLQENYEKLEAKTKQAEEQLQKLDSVYAKALQRDRERAAQQIKALQARQERAVEEGDTDAWKRARMAEDQLRESMQEPAQDNAPKQEIPPDVASALDNWRVDKDWFGQDQEKTQQAVALWDEATSKGIRDPQAILKYVDRKMAPVEEAPKPKTAAFDDGLAIGGSPDPFVKLPAEAKTAFKRMVKQGLFEDTKEGRAQYVKDYNDA